MSHDDLDALGHLGYLMLIGGQVLIGRHHVSGWIARWFGSALWLWLGTKLDLNSVVVWSAIFLAVDVYGSWRWRRVEALRA